MRYKLSEIMYIIGGGTPKTSESKYWNGKIPWLSVKDFKNNNKCVYKTEKTITESGLNHSSTVLLHENDIIISARGTVGEMAMIPFPMAFNQSCYGLRAKTEIVNSDFLYYLIKYNVHILKKNTHGSVFDTITRNTFESIDVDIPPLSEQEKISSILSLLDDKIELNNRINENLEQQARAIFDSMFHDSIYGDKTIGEYIIPQRGKSLIAKNAIPGNIPVIAGGTKPAAYHNAANTKPPVITIAASGTAGFVNIWHIPVWSSDSSFIDSTMTENIYFWYIMLKTRQEEIYSARVGSVQPHIYPQHIAAMPIGNIDSEQVKIFTETVTPFFELIGSNLAQNERLAQIRDSLLPKLISGELDISGLDL